MSKDMGEGRGGGYINMTSTWVKASDLSDSHLVEWEGHD